MSLTEEKCLQAWTNSLKQMNAKADIVFFGDSLIYYGDFASVFPDKVVCNLGLRGDTLQGMKNRVEQVKLLKPKTVYLMAGINDVANNSVIEFREQYETLLKTIIDQNPTAELFVFNMLPVNDVDFIISCNNEQIKRCNSIITHLSTVYGIPCVDLYTLYESFDLLPKDMTVDGIHLTKDAYQLWYNAIPMKKFS